LPNFPQDFHRYGDTNMPHLLPPRRKWLNPKYLYGIKSPWQVQENNTTFIFWLLPRGIPGEMCAKNARIGMQASGFGIREVTANNSEIQGLRSVLAEDESPKPTARA